MKLTPNIATLNYKVRLSLNECPLAPEQMCPSLSPIEWNSLSLNRYMTPDHGPLMKELQLYTGFSANGILIGNGADELILAALLALTKHRRRILVNQPSYNMYEICGRMIGLEVTKSPLTDSFQLDTKKIIQMVNSQKIPLLFICRPHNPTGSLFDRSSIKEILNETDAYIVVDEAYFEYVGDSLQNEIQAYSRLLVLRTLSKAFAAAGLRIGYLLGDPITISAVREALLPYNVGVVAQHMGAVLLRERQHFLAQVQRDLEQRERLRQALNALPGVTALPSHANFFLCKLPQDPEVVCHSLSQLGIAVRQVCHMDPRLKNMIRVSVGTWQENQVFLSALARVLKGV